MARFYLSGRYGNYRGNYFSAGGRFSIDHTHTRGWHAGVEIECYALEDGTDRFDVYMTPGSSGAGHRVLLGSVAEKVTKNKRRTPRWIPAKGKKSVR